MTSEKLWHQLDEAVAMCYKAFDLIDDIEDVLESIDVPSPFGSARYELADALDALKSKQREIECAQE